MELFFNKLFVDFFVGPAYVFFFKLSASFYPLKSIEKLENSTSMFCDQ